MGSITSAIPNLVKVKLSPPGLLSSVRSDGADVHHGVTGRQCVHCSSWSVALCWWLGCLLQPLMESARLPWEAGIVTTL